MKNSGYLNDLEIKNLKLDIGKNNLISRNAKFYSKDIVIGNNCRIDDGVIFKGKIILKNNIHIARGCTLSGGNKGIFVDNLVGISNFTQIFSTSDDYSKEYLPGATLNKKLQEKYSKIKSTKIIIGKAVLIGAMSCILPGSTFEDFASCKTKSIVYFKIKSGQYIDANFGKKIIRQKNIKIMKEKYDELMANLKIDGGHGKN